MARPSRKLGCIIPVVVVGIGLAWLAVFTAVGRVIALVVLVLLVAGNVGARRRDNEHESRRVIEADRRQASMREEIGRRLAQEAPDGEPGARWTRPPTADQSETGQPTPWERQQAADNERRLRAFRQAGRQADPEAKEISPERRQELERLVRAFLERKQRDAKSEDVPPAE